MLDEVRADYVLLAKAKGMKKSRIMLTHCLRNVMPSYLSIMAISVAHIMGGTYVVETVFPIRESVRWLMKVPVIRIIIC